MMLFSAKSTLLQIVKKCKSKGNVEFAAADLNMNKIQTQSISEVVKFNTSTPAPSKTAK